MQTRTVLVSKCFIYVVLFEGLSSVSSYHSFPLTEQLLDVLEAKEFDLDALLKLLGLERRPLQHLKTVREVVNYYEEHYTEHLSLQTWKRIFEGLGYSEDFLRVVTHFNEQRHGQGKHNTTAVSCLKYKILIGNSLNTFLAVTKIVAF